MARPFALIIEDQKTLAMLFEDALRLVGYDVKVIHNGLEALNYLELNDAPSMILLDVNLPLLSGRDIHKYIRSSERFTNMPVLVLTANSLMIDTLRPELTENDYVAMKPIGMKELQDLAKAMRPTNDGKTEYMAKTQPIPDLAMLPFDDEDTSQTIDTKSDVIPKPDADIANPDTDDDAAKVDTPANESSSQTTDTKDEVAPETDADIVKPDTDDDAAKADMPANESSSQTIDTKDEVAPKTDADIAKPDSEDDTTKTAASAGDPSQSTDISELETQEHQTVTPDTKSESSNTLEKD